MPRRRPYSTRPTPPKRPTPISGASFFSYKRKLIGSKLDLYVKAKTTEPDFLQMPFPISLDTLQEQEQRIVSFVVGLLFRFGEPTHHETYLHMVQSPAKPVEPPSKIALSSAQAGVTFDLLDPWELSEARTLFKHPYPAFAILPNQEKETSPHLWVAIWRPKQKYRWACLFINCPHLVWGGVCQRKETLDSCSGARRAYRYVDAWLLRRGLVPSNIDKSVAEGLDLLKDEMAELEGARAENRKISNIVDSVPSGRGLDKVLPDDMIRTERIIVLEEPPVAKQPNSA